jgi:hypothetical protein
VEELEVKRLHLSLNLLLMTMLIIMISRWLTDGILTLQSNPLMVKELTDLVTIKNTIAETHHVTLILVVAQLN